MKNSLSGLLMLKPAMCMSTLLLKSSQISHQGPRQCLLAKNGTDWLDYVDNMNQYGQALFLRDPFLKAFLMNSYPFLKAFLLRGNIWKYSNT